MRLAAVSDAAPVTVMLYPDAVHLHGTGRAELDNMLRSLVARGLRAKLVQSPPLVGSRNRDSVRKIAMILAIAARRRSGADTRAPAR